MNINVKVVLRTSKVYKDQTSPLFIRLIQKKRVKFIFTGIKINPVHWDSKACVLTEDCPSREEIQQQIDAKLGAVNRQIAKFEILEMEPDLDAFGDQQKNRFNPLLHDCFHKHISKLKQSGKINTSIKYTFTLSSLEKFRKGSKIRDVTPSFLLNFEQFLREQGNLDNTIATKMSVLKALYNKEKGEGALLSQEHPFNNYKIGSLLSPTKKRAVSKDTVKKLEGLDLSSYASPYVEIARDIFLFSYYTAGMNFRDIAFLTWENIEDNRIIYSRRKTNKRISCLLMKPVQQIIERYSTGDSGDYIFPILNKLHHKTESQIHDRLHKVLQKVNKHLKEEISTALNLKTPITTYVARHTYATVLKRSGVDLALISESLGHSDLSTTQIYLDSFENSQIDEAMENLL